MPKFGFQTADGKTHEIDAPDYETAKSKYRAQTAPAPAPDPAATSSLEAEPEPQGYRKVDPAQDPNAPAPFTWSGLGKQALASTVTGGSYLAGMASNLGANQFPRLLEKYAMPYVYDQIDKLYPPSEEAQKRRQETEAEGGALSGQGIQKLLTKGLHAIGADNYIDINRQPENVPEEYARTIGEAVAPTIAGGGGVMGMLKGLSGAVTSEAAGQIARQFEDKLPDRPKWLTDSKVDKYIPSVETAARVIGGFVGPTAVDRAHSAITPHPDIPEPRTQAAATFRERRIPVTAGQLTEDEGLRQLEGNTGRAAAQPHMRNQSEQFSRAALENIDINDPRGYFTTGQGGNLPAARARIGAEFDRLGSTNTLIPDMPMGRAMSDAYQGYAQTTTANMPRGMVDLYNDVAASVRSGQISGPQYQNFITRLRKLADATTDAGQANAYRGMRDALNDAMERSIAANNPADLGAWRNARSQYADLIAIEDAATRAGGKSGLITPEALKAARLKQGGKTGYLGGRRDLDELAQAGSLLMVPLKSSGTKENIFAGLSPLLKDAGIGTWIGGALGSLGGPLTSAAGAVGGTLAGGALNRLKNRAIMSEPVQAYLKNQLLPAQTPNTGGGLLRMIERSGSAVRSGERKGRKGGGW